MRALSDRGTAATPTARGGGAPRANGPVPSAAVTPRPADEEAVARVLASMPPEGDLVDAADVFGLLGDPHRLRLLMALLAAGELCVGDLAAVGGMSESAVSHALRLLRAHRVVAVARRGRMAYYRLDDAHVRTLLELGLTHTQHTDAVHPERGRGRQ